MQHDLIEISLMPQSHTLSPIECATGNELIFGFDVSKVHVKKYFAVAVIESVNQEHANLSRVNSG